VPLTEREVANAKGVTVIDAGSAYAEGVRSRGFGDCPEEYKIFGHPRFAFPMTITLEFGYPKKVLSFHYAIFHKSEIYFGGGT